MPMSWTPENDRLLLLKLIETHGISVDTAKIAAAWPDGGLKPTARAVTERFVKLRKEAGIKGSGSKPRITPSSNKFTTPKKRKVKNDSEESDAEEHETDEEDTPTKPSARRGGTGARSHARGGGSARGGRGAMLAARSPAMNIKSEFPRSEFNPITLHRDSSQAAHLLRRVEDPFTDLGMPRNKPLPALSRETYDETNFAAPSMEPGNTTFSNGFATAPNTPGKSCLASVAGEDVPASRPRSSRKASVQASEGMSLWLHRQKYEDEEDGARSSEEDSQDSDENFNLEEI